MEIRHTEKVNGVKYALAPNGIFWTIQGEGVLSGLPMVFVRLAGCPLNCKGCDTDYSVSEKNVSVEDISRRVGLYQSRATHWTWVTGGEPAKYELWPLLAALRLKGKIGLVTSGHFDLGAGSRLIDCLYVSPHSKPDDLKVATGSQINLVPGLNGLRLADWKGYDFSRFGKRYVTPCYGDSESLKACVEWIRTQDDEWLLGSQAHKQWGIA